MAESSPGSHEHLDQQPAAGEPEGTKLNGRRTDSKPASIGDIIARITALEQRMPEATQLIESVIRLGQNIDQCQKGLLHISQQRAAADVQMERNTRALALDLAIKGAPPKPGEAPNAIAILDLGAAFLGWLKGGDKGGEAPAA